MRKWLVWLVWIVAIAALLGAANTRLQQASKPATNSCTTPIYWESPLLK